jgi:hypothetical protein
MKKSDKERLKKFDKGSLDVAALVYYRINILP